MDVREKLIEILRKPIFPLQVCTNIKSDNFLAKLEIAFDNCKLGIVDDDEE